jgi:polyferredoxin
MTAIARSRPTTGSARRIRRGLSALRGVQGFRRLVQAAVALLVLDLVVSRPETMAGAATSPEALCPFGGLETIVRFVTTGVYVPHVHSSNVILAAAVLLTAFLARGAFCGWLCPFGFLQDLVSGLSATVQARVRPVRSAVRALERNAAPLARLDRPLRLLKYAVLAWSIWGAAAFGFMVFRDVDPWIALLDLGRASLGFASLVLVVVLMGALFVERPWCRYACPLGAANGLVARFSPVYLQRVESACTSCGQCSKACPMGIDVATATTITSVDCNGCLECVESCPRAGALDLRVGLPILPVLPTASRRPVA